MQKRTPWKKSHKIFETDIYSQYSLTYFQHLSTLREPTGDILYIVSTFRRVCWISRIHYKMQRMFFFFGRSLSNDSFRVAIFTGVCFAIHIGIVVFVFRFLFCIFLQCPFLYRCRICTYWAKRKHTNYSRNSSR